MNQNVPILGQPEQESQDPAQQTGPWVRVLVCYTCRSMEVFPDFTGRPDNDVYVHEIDFKHGGAETDPTRVHERVILRPEQKTWDNPKIRRAIVKQAFDGRTGFVPEYYDFKDTLKEDAFKCFKAHHSSVPCIDYRDSSKRIGNPAAQDKKLLAKEMGKDYRDFGPGPRVYLCEFCKVESVVEQMKQDKYGDNYGK